MKAIFLTTVLATLFSFSNIYAGNSKDKVYSNIETTRYGCTKEYTTVDGTSLEALKKAVFVYDTKNNLKEKTYYKWSSQGWVGTYKYVYEYNSDGSKVANLIFTKWDKNMATWSTKSQHLIHVYDDASGKLLTVKQVQVNNNSSGLIANK